MKIPIYILGFLKRYGSQHGYLLKKNIEDQVSDFANIKLPTLYYHLNKMVEKGLISVKIEKEGKRPDKWVYSITELGEKQLGQMLLSSFDRFDKIEFEIDSVFFFIDQLSKDDVIQKLESYILWHEETLVHLIEHRKELKTFLGENFKFPEIIFDHHQKYYSTELKWAKQTLTKIKEYL